MKPQAERRLAERYLEATRPGRLPREWALVGESGVLAAATAPHGLHGVRAEVGGSVHYMQGGVPGLLGWAAEREAWRLPS